MLATCLSGIVACSSSSSPAGGGDGTSPNRIVIRGPEGTLTSVFPAELQLSLGTTPILELSVEGNANGNWWSVLADLPMDQATSGQVNVALSDGHVTSGVASLYLESSAGKTTATSGVFRASISGGKITAQVQATPTILDASISGDVSVECDVPVSDLPSATDAGGISVSPGTVLVDDATFSTKLCAPFKGLQ